MPHTNITDARQKVYTKQGNIHFVEPGDTINEEVIRVLDVAAQEPDDCAEVKAGRKPKSVEKTAKQKEAESDVKSGNQKADD